MEEEFEKKMNEMISTLTSKLQEEQDRNKKFLTESLEINKRIAIALEGINITLVRILEEE